MSAGDSNRGRICIGNMDFYESEYNMPLSGSELDYEPESLNNTYVSNALQGVSKLDRGSLSYHNYVMKPLKLSGAENLI